MAVELKQAFEMAAKSQASYVLLKANGKNFCTGADLEWMKNSASLTPEENVEDMSVIMQMYKSMLEISVPIITYVQGKVRGGGMGLLACSDYVIADPDSDFALSEVKLGLIPGIISPFIFHRTGMEVFTTLASSGEVFDSARAKAINLVHEITKDKDHLFGEKNICLSHGEILKYFGDQTVERYLFLSAEKRQSPEFLAKVKSIIK